ncbi:Putative uncharacterized protein [Taphrina deformans PYCC 5710]|uniref:F1F0 ATP synthase assembly protein Atp11 n=1 Tax=Taphrina deformans (strain PYCC 5710 / ATCC 11124 / CBS 356.35 / IMI 108563 / JCM 9778 / NBRC 8474) TaxID=1097556 RepID=R4XBX1_TAPDE|nr:Putative uncharacterized protein [Taphrina deformans PYCC 5710]|eukprot:CCG80840.1 Putative uncharacterized protein [Taphrina deformans PYCC 5710]
MSRRFPLLNPCRSASILSHVPNPSRSYASIAEKYQEKLKQRAAAYVAFKNGAAKSSNKDSEGLRGGNAIEQLRARYAQRVKSQSSIVSPQAAPSGTTKTPKLEIPKVPAKSPVKSLSSYIDVDKLLLHEAKEIELLWRARFADSEGSICAVIPQGTYTQMYRTARQNPMFVLPLFRPGQGVEMHFLQWMFPNESTSHLMITSLLEYKMKGEYSRPHTIIAHHTELAAEKGLVLMKGDLTDSRSLEPLQATWMITLLQRFYCPSASDSTSARRSKILSDFNKGIDLNVDALIEEAKAVPGAGEV